MDLQKEKCVMVIDENLPSGIIANTAAIMGITLGRQRPEVVGADVYDRTGKGHLGINLGIAICGAKKKVNKLTGSMALLR